MNQTFHDEGALRAPKIRITKLICSQTGTYNPMYNRPYETHFNGDLANRIIERVEESARGNGGSAGTMLAGMAGEFVAPSHQPQGMVAIPNGWDRPRGRFMMRVEVTQATGTVNYYYLQGYTSHFDLSYNRVVDPNIEFFVNSVIGTVVINFHHAGGVVSEERVMSSNQIINGRVVSQGSPTNTVAGMRPQDVYAQIRQHQLEADLGQRADYYDSSTDLSSISSMSSRMNNLPVSYLTGVVNAYTTAQAVSAYGNDTMDAFGRARDLVADNTLSDNPFFRAIAGQIGVGNPMSFRMAHLQRLDPGVNHESVSRFQVLDPNAMTKLPVAGQTEYWHNPNDRHVQVAVMLLHGVPSLMSAYMLTKLAFKATNAFHGGMNQVFITGCMDLASRNTSQYLEAFKQRFVQEVMMDITHNNQELYDITVEFDLLGSTTLSVSMNGRPPTPFQVPSFCDSLLAPTYSVNGAVLRDTSSDMYQLLSEVSNTSLGTTSVNMGI